MWLRSMRDLGSFDKAPCTIIPPSATAEQLRNYTVLDNQQAGEWDLSRINADWGEDFFEDLGIDLADFQESETEKTENDLKEDDFDPDLQEETPLQVRDGDLFELGRHRLICGDCTKAKTMDALMGGASTDLIISDPPYNVDYGQHVQGLKRAKNASGPLGSD